MPMKKICITFLVLVIIISTAVIYSAEQPQTQKGEYLRIHVRANSNLDIDQAVKYKVKDAVVEYLTPLAAKCTDKTTAQALISSNLDKIVALCNQTLANNGFNYASRANLRREQFPTRVYGDLTLESGEYDALIIELGEGVGDNWWCVIYPPLCFTSSVGNVKYRSAIIEIINRFFKEEK